MGKVNKKILICVDHLGEDVEFSLVNQMEIHDVMASQTQSPDLSILTESSKSMKNKKSKSARKDKTNKLVEKSSEQGISRSDEEDINRFAKEMINKSAKDKSVEVGLEKSIEGSTHPFIPLSSDEETTSVVNDSIKRGLSRFPLNMFCRRINSSSC